MKPDRDIALEMALVALWDIALGRIQNEPRYAKRMLDHIAEISRKYEILVTAAAHGKRPISPSGR